MNKDQFAEFLRHASARHLELTGQKLTRYTAGRSVSPELIGVLHDAGMTPLTADQYGSLMADPDEVRLFAGDAEGSE